MTGPDLDLMVGTEYAGPAGSFTDASPSPSPVVSFFSVSGPSAPPVASITQSGNTFTVNIDYTPDTPGVSSIGMNVSDSQNGLFGCQSGTIRVHQLQPSPFEFGGTEGQPLPSNGPISGFSDNGSIDPSGLTATCNFGDGTPAAPVTISGSGFFLLNTNHVWAINGDYNVTCTVTLTSTGATMPLNTVAHIQSSDTFDMDYLDPTVPSDVAVGVVGTIFDSNASTTAAQLTAYIGWDDGIVEQATLTGGSGLFTVHSTRALHGPIGFQLGYELGVMETTPNGNNAFQCGSLFCEARAAAPGPAPGPSGPCFGRCRLGVVTIGNGLFPASQQIQAFPNTQWSGIAAGFWGNPFSNDGDYMATIDWGDGSTPTAGVIKRNGNDGFFEIDGTHTWTKTGTFNVVATVTDRFQSTLTVNSIALVQDAALSVSANTLTTQLGSMNALAVGQFSVPGGSATPSDFTASIDWGDGSTASMGTISGGRDLFSVSATHTYAAAGVYSVKLTVTDTRTPGGSASAKGTITVSDSALAITAPGSLVETTGVGFTFGFDWKDGDTTATTGKYAVTVGWGDGSTDSTATVTAASGGFHASADHTYAMAGSYDLEVTITDTKAVGGATVLANFTVKVNVQDKATSPSPMPSGNNSSSSCSMGGSATGEGMFILLSLFALACVLRRRGVY